MRFTTYEPKYFEKLLILINEADKIDKANLGMTKEQLQHLVNGPDFGHGDVLLAIADGSVVGYVRLDYHLGSEQPRVGCFGIVRPDYRRNGIGAKLVQLAKDVVADHIENSVAFYVPVRHSVKGLQQLVESLGMQPTRYFYVLKYDKLPQLPANPLFRSGISIRNFESEAFIAPYTELLNEVFGYKNTEDEIRQEITKPNFDPTLWHYAFERDKLVGFCICQQYDDEAEVEYLGVHKNYRGQGLGYGLLSLGVRSLAAKGFENIHLAVNTTNTSALKLYQSVGFVEWRKSTTYSMVVEPKRESIV